MFKRVLFTVLILALLAVSATTIFAGTGSISGTITTGDPTMPVVFISPPNCTGQGASLVRYHVYPFTVDTSGDYTFSVTSDDSFASMYLFAGTFTPEAAFPTCIAGDNSGNPVDFTETLTAGTQYFWVIFDDTFSQLGGAYSGTVTGPGNITLGSAACPYPLPVGSVVYSVPGGAPTFWAADLATQNTWNLPAGSWYISEFSGDFAKVWMACEARPFWIPANTVSR